MTSAFALGLSRSPLMTPRYLAALHYEAAHVWLGVARAWRNRGSEAGFLDALLRAREARRRAREARS